MGELLGHLLKNLGNLILPPECYIYMKNRHPGRLALIWIGLLVLAAPGLSCVFILPIALLSMIGTNNLGRDLWMVLECLLTIAGTAGVLTVVRMLVHRLWKPTPEMLADNDAAVAKELQQMEEEARITPEEHQELHTWLCPSCGTRNGNPYPACIRCGARREE